VASVPFYSVSFLSLPFSPLKMSFLSSVQVQRYDSYIGIRIAPTESQPRFFHIAFVLDVSGSMMGERLDTVKRTLHLFANEMQPEDRASIIAYNQEARVVCREEGADSLRNFVDGLHADGGTNMVDAVFLLTDGEVNQGISSTRGLEQIARTVAFGAQKIPVYTLGYGADHNARLLQAIAVTTRASYTFAESNEMIPSVVGSIFVAMRDEVAKGVTLEWDSAASAEGEAATCWEPGALADARSYCVGSVIANKPQWIILKGDVTSLTIHASNTDRHVLIVPSEGRDEDVLEQWFRAEAVRVFGEVLEAGVLGLPRLQVLEDAIVASPVAGRPMMISLLGKIAEQRDILDQMARRPPPPMNAGIGLMRYGGGGGGYGGGYLPPATSLSRFVSHVTAFATQRGAPEFDSPSQRMASGAMTRHFTGQVSGSQDVDQDPTDFASQATGTITPP
jgi:hypothetical protein